MTALGQTETNDISVQTVDPHRARNQFSFVFGCATMLRWAANAARETAKQNLTDGVISARGHDTMVVDKSGHAKRRDLDDNNRYAKQLETLLARVDQLKDGAFSPLSQQPLVRAVLLPMGSVGWTALMEKGRRVGTTDWQRTLFQG